MAAPPTTPPTVAKSVAGAETVAGTSYAGSLDLNASGRQLPLAWLVAGVTRLSVQAVLSSGSWGTATVAIRGSVDGTTWTSIVTLTGVGFSDSVIVEQYQFVQLEVTLVESAAGVASFSGYGFAPPFDRRDISVLGILDAYDALGNQTVDGTDVTVNIDTERVNTDTAMLALSSDELTLNLDGPSPLLDVEYRCTIGTTGSGDFSFEVYLEQAPAATGVFAEIAGTRLASGKGT